MAGPAWTTAAKGPVLGEDSLIFVAVGFHPRGFERLVRAMDSIAEKTEEEVVIQIGNTAYEPRFASYFRFKDSDAEIDELIGKARIVVSHSGVGCILKGLEQGKNVIVIPRMKSLGEHVDDHQSETAERFSHEGLVYVAQKVSEIESILLDGGKVRQVPDNPYSAERKRLLEALRSYIQFQVT